MQPGEKAFIIHICSPTAWEKALLAGEYRTTSLESQGFIHCSLPAQIEWVANQYYRGQADLILLWINPAHLTSSLRWEQADGKVFPHVYGPLNLEAVIFIQPYNPGPDGTFLPIEYA
jgi:uncharacterized protein (DUF952 family)